MARMTLRFIALKRSISTLPFLRERIKQTGSVHVQFSINVFNHFIYSVLFRLFCYDSLMNLSRKGNSSNVSSI